MDKEVKIIKLITGETVVTYIQGSEHPKYTTISHPLVFNTMYKPSGDMSIIATKWMESETYTHKIQNHHIVTSAAASETIKEMYINSVEDMIEHDDEDDEDFDFEDSEEQTEINEENKVLH